MAETSCAHIEAITTVKHGKRRERGGTRCCDDSPNQHASKHARASKHPMIASAEPGERWLYCYPDDAFMEY